MRFRLLVVLLVLFSIAASAQRRDPLAPAEVDQLRDFAQEPQRRIPLFIKFAQVRMLAIDQLRADPNTTERGRKLRELIEDLTTIVDEFGDNLEMYGGRKEDMRKGLKQAIEGLSDLQLRVRALRQYANDPAQARERGEYDFALTTLEEAVNGAAQDARDLLDEQNALAEAAKQAKKKKK